MRAELATPPPLKTPDADLHADMAFDLPKPRAKRGHNKYDRSFKVLQSSDRKAIKKHISSRIDMSGKWGAWTPEQRGIFVIIKLWEKFEDKEEKSQDEKSTTLPTVRQAYPERFDRTQEERHYLNFFREAIEHGRQSHGGRAGAHGLEEDDDEPLPTGHPPDIKVEPEEDEYEYGSASTSYKHETQVQQRYYAQAAAKGSLHTESDKPKTEQLAGRLRIVAISIASDPRKATKPYWGWEDGKMVVIRPSKHSTTNPDAKRKHEDDVGATRQKKEARLL